jgi:hypothetical protein
MEGLLLGLRVAAAAALYGFLVALLLMLRRDLGAEEDRPEGSQPAARMVVLETEDRVLEAGTVFVLQPLTSIGRGRDNTISIPDSFASTHHALVSWRGSQWWLEDQGSRNGTLINGLAVDRPVVVTTGDVISIGRTAFRLEREDGPRSER